MKKYTLKGDKRDVVGRKVKTLRAKGQIPATVYGRNVKSLSVVVDQDAFIKVYSQAGETGLVELSVASDVRPVLIHSVQKDPVGGKILHVEFYQVDLKQKVHTNVPIELFGDAPAVIGKVGVLLTITDEIEVEALPTELPEKITVDVTNLREVNEEIKVAEVKAPSGVTILTAPDQIIVRVGSLISKEAEAQAAAEAAAAAAAAAAAQPSEGAEAGATETKPEAAPAAEPKAAAQEQVQEKKEG